MDTAKQEQHHLDRFIAAGPHDEFGPSRVQRICQIGYNNACYVIERGVQTKVFVQGSKPWTYRLAPSTPPATS